MFERIKCYKRLIRAEKLLRGSVRIGEILQDNKMIYDSKEALRKSEYIKKNIWRNRKMAYRYNLEFDKHGF